MRLRRPGTASAPAHTTGLTAGQNRRGPARARRAAGVTLLIGLFGLTLAAVAAQATTFPGTNGRIAASGPLHDFAPADPLASELESRLELFTLDNAFVADPGAVPSNLQQCQLTDNPNSDFNPRFSKDGKKIAYIRDNNVWTLQLDNDGKCAADTDNDGDPGPGAPKQLTGALQEPLAAIVGGDDSYVGGWCTDGGGQEWIVFQRGSTTHSFDIYKQKIKPNRDPDGAPMVLHQTTSSESQPAVTPDCTKVAFQSNRAATGTANPDVWVGDFDGDPIPEPSSLVNRTDCSQVEESAPSWSPSINSGTVAGQGGTGTNYRIAFQTNRDPVAGVAARNLEIYRMDDADSAPADGCGDNPTRLTYNVATNGGASSDLTGFDLSPVYSPDGKKMCFHSGRKLNSAAGGGGYQWDVYVLEDVVKGEVHTEVDTSTTPPTTRTVGSASTRKTNRDFNDERCGWQETPGP